MPKESEFEKAYFPHKSWNARPWEVALAMWNARGAADAKIADKQILRHTDGSAAIDECSLVAMEIIEEIQKLDEKEQG